MQEIECDEEDIAVCDISVRAGRVWHRIDGKDENDLQSWLGWLFCANCNGNIVANSAVRKGAYKLFTYMKFSQLGKGNRIPIPDCVTRLLEVRCCKAVDMKPFFCGHSSYI